MKVTWVYDDGSKLSRRFCRVKKQEILAKSREWRYGCDQDEYIVRLVDNSYADLYSVCYSLWDMFRSVYKEDWRAFTTEFWGWKFYATSETTLYNLIGIPPTKDCVIQFEDGAPTAVIYRNYSFRDGEIVLEKLRKGVLYDTHQGKTLCKVL